MNRIYQVIWSSVKDCYVVVSENAGRHGKKKAVHLAPSTTKRTMLAMSLGAAVLMGSGSAAEAATGNKIIGGIEGVVIDTEGKEDQAQATGDYSTISGGVANHAEGKYSSVSGGSKNHATGESASISGGGDGVASGAKSSVSGGRQNKATGEFASISGGDQNEAAGKQSTVSGGTANKATGDWSTIIGGAYNVTSGNSSLALGGMQSSVQGMYSVGIAGGSTSSSAYQGFAAGYQSSVNVANGMALGYQAVAKTANTISFGHVAGDTYYSADQWDHIISTNTFQDTYYNRLVNVADGIDDHDVVVMEQLKALASQGMNFQGNDTSTSVHLNQGGTLLLQGSGTKADEEYSTQNVKVLTDAANQRLSIALDKNPDFDSVTAGGVKMGTQTDGNDTTKRGNYVTGLDNKTWTVGQTQPVDGRAATENQLKSVSDVVNSNKTQITTNTNNIAKGLNFSASNKVDGAYKTVNRALGSTVAVRANDAQDGHTYKTDNLTTEIDDNGIITVKMDTKLTADKVTVGTGDNAITLDGSNGNVTTGSSTLGGTGLTIINGPSVTTSGISGGSKQITEVKSGASSMDDSNNPIYGTDTNAANIGDVKKIAAKTVTVSGDGKNTTVAKTPNADGTVDYKVSLNDSVTLGSDAGKRIALDGTSGTISAGDKVSLNGATGTATIGNAHLGNDGSNTYLTGLTNTTWNGTAVSGRAATEDQLQTVSNTVNAGWKAQIDGTDVKTVTPTNNTLNFVAGDNISLSSGNDIKDIKIATTPDVNFTTVRVGGTKGTGTDTYTGGIYIGSQPGGGANSGTGFYITGLQNTNWNANSIVSGRAATEDQLQQVANAIVNGKETGGGFGLSDNAGTVVKQDLGGAIQLKAADSNLTTTADTTTGKAITIGLSKTLTDMTSATFKDDTTGATTVIDGKGIAITPQNGSTGSQVKLTTDGLSNGGKQITNVQSGLYDTAQNKPVDISSIAAGSSMLQNAATIGDLQTVSNGVKTDLTDTGLNFKGNKVNNKDTTVHRNLGETLTIQGTGEDGRNYDGGANVQVLADDKTGTLTVQLDRDLNAHTLTLGKASNGTETEEAGTLILNGKNKDNGMSPVSIGVTYRGNQDKEAMKTAMSRITYKGGNGNDHTVATLEDGLQLAGDNGTAIDTTLNKKVTIKGGAKTDKLVDSSDSTKNNNIGVTTNTDNDGNTVLSLQLAKDITGLNTVTAGTVVMGNQSVVSEDKVPGSGNFVTGLDNKAWDGKDFVSGRAATEDQLKKVSDSIRDTVGASTFAVTAGGQGEATDATITKKVGESIRIFGDAPKVSGGGDGDGWDRSKANILTKVKKDNHGDSYVSVELQDHLEVGVHDGTDADGKAIEGTDGSMQFKGKAAANEVMVTGDTGVTLNHNGNQAAVLHQTDGTGYLDLTGSQGAFTSLFTHQGTQNLASDQDSASNTRLAYTDKSSKTEHQVATLDDGLVIAGDNGQVTRLLNSTLKLSGGETDPAKLSSGKNIGVVANKDKNGLDIKLAKDLTDIDSITMTGGLTLNSSNGSSTITGLSNKRSEEHTSELQSRI